MSLNVLMTAFSAIAAGVGLFAIVRPVPFLESKGAIVTPAAVVWMRELGVLILAQGLTAFLLRHESVSVPVRSFLVGGALTQFGLLPIEIVAFRRGTLTRLSGVVPNSVLHAALGCALLFRALS
jgi:hypothetical protein